MHIHDILIFPRLNDIILLKSSACSASTYDYLSITSPKCLVNSVDGKVFCKGGKTGCYGRIPVAFHPLYAL